MSNVATFELTTDVSPSVVELELSKYWKGLGYKVDICFFWEDKSRFLCVLEYFYSRDSYEIAMMVKAAKYLIEVATSQRILYYRAFDGIGFFDPKNHAPDSASLTWISEYVPETITSDDLYCDRYKPSMSEIEMFVVVASR
jgi:hypothetical protein